MYMTGDDSQNEEWWLAGRQKWSQLHHQDGFLHKYYMKMSEYSSVVRSSLLSLSAEMFD